MLDIITVKDVKIKLGSLVKLLRKREGLTQVQLAEKLALSRITIQNLEAGKNATTDTLLKVLQYYDLLIGLSTVIDNEIKNNSYESLY